MKTNKFLIFLFISSLLLSSCDNGFEEMNQNPNSPTVVPSAMLIPGIAKSAVDNQYTMFVGADMGAIWAQQLSKVQYNDEERFYPRSGVIDGFWNGIYASVVADAQEMYKIADAEGNDKVKGVANILKAYGFLVLTDCYGSIPFSEALQGADNNFTPKYDSQSEVYNGSLALLDDAVALLGGAGSIDATSDIIYHGDSSKWVKFANSLKFRALMRISGKVDVSGQLQTLYDGGMMFTSRDDEAKLVYLAAPPNSNPIYNTVVDGNRGEYKACTTLTGLMESKSDGRLSTYFDLNEDDVIRGKVPGVADVPSDEYNYTNVSAIGEFFLSPESPGYFLTYSELEFLIAEAAVKDYITGADADTHFKNGIIASFDAAGLANGPSYAGAQGSATLTKIYEEKYVALFLQGVEAWTEVRRTGVPTMQEVVDKNPSVEKPMRYYYNTVEASINAANYNAAVSAQGTDALDTPVWWMQ